MFKKNKILKKLINIFIKTNIPYQNKIQKQNNLIFKTKKMIKCIFI